MKKITFLSLLLAFLLAACAGSDSYRGKWKATNADGEKAELNFKEKLFSITEASGKKSDYEYTQNSVKYENGKQSYGITLSDGRGYQIVFPNSDDETVGIITDENGAPMFTISRKEYLTYEDVYKL
ncbi:MAG: glycosyl transferase [Flavobacterium sp.]|uniref:hypothetical protein n=1 Tax=Flavobacterium sp. TaxID=239 RepID=UPI0011F95E79|nr:hypothetical protein [Flavobacterium sp.]RZJ68475.1 MAG: glycosyl transferase [Flavobacterium sp.]